MKSQFFEKINSINKLLAIKLDNLEEMDKDHTTFWVMKS